MEKRLHLIIHGRVQGIGYRYSAVRQARALGLTGFVRNCGDGTVEVVAEGEEKHLAQLLAWCKNGPMLARVTTADEHWEECRREFQDFSTFH